MLVSLGLIAFLVKQLDWHEVAAHLATVRYMAFVPCLAIFVAHYVLRAWRWRYLLPHAEVGEAAPLSGLLNAIMLGNFATYILPLRAGEFVRPYMLSRTKSHSFSVAFVSVVVERFFDLAAVLFSFGLMLLYLQGIPSWVHKGALALSLVAVAILFFIVLGALFPSSISALIDTLSGFLPKNIGRPIAHILKELLRGALVLRNFKNLLMVILLTAAVWLSCYYLSFMLFALFDIQGSFWMALSITVIIALSVAAPSAPGFLGVYQVACVAGFAIFGVNQELAASFAIVTHLFHYLIFLSYGSIFLLRSRLTLADLKHSAA